MRVTMLLCDFAQAAEGKLYVMGGGWSIRGEMAPMALAIKIDVPWSDTNRAHTWRLSLVDADGSPVQVESAEGMRPIEVGDVFEVGRPPGLPEGTPIDLPLAINIAPVPLPPGARYTWRLEIDDRTEETWQVSFLTRAG